MENEEKIKGADSAERQEAKEKVKEKRKMSTAKKVILSIILLIIVACVQVYVLEKWARKL